MAMNQLVSIGGTSAGVSLPLDELRDEGVVSGGRGGESLEIEETMLRVERFDRGAWQVVRTDVTTSRRTWSSRRSASRQQPTVEA